MCAALAVLAVPPSPNDQRYDTMEPLEIDDVLLKVYCVEQVPNETGVNDNIGAGKAVSVWVKVGPGQPGTRIVVQV